MIVQTTSGMKAANPPHMARVPSIRHGANKASLPHDLSMTQYFVCAPEGEWRHQLSHNKILTKLRTEERQLEEH